MATPSYSKTTWVDNSTPSINASNLNKIEDQLEDLTDELNVIDAEAGAKGAGYWFDGVDDYIDQGINADLDIGTSDASFVFDIGQLPGILTASFLFASYTPVTFDSQSIWINGGSIRISLKIGGVLVTSEGSTVLSGDDKNHNIICTIDRDSATGLKIFVDGTEESYQTQDDLTALIGAITSTSNKYIGANYSGSYNLHGMFFQVLQFNLALSANETEMYSNGLSVPYKYVGASQTPLTSGILIPDKQYIIDTYVAGDDFTNIGGTNVSGNSFVATGTTPTTWTNSSSLRQIGCIAQYTQNGRGHNQWLDVSGNEFHGEVSGPILTNIPANHTEKVIKKSVTGDTLWADIVPVGYLLERMIFEETAGNQAILDMGTADGANDVFTGETIAASDITVIEINKMFSSSVVQTLDLNDDQAGSSWNSASIDITLIMRRIQI